MSGSGSYLFHILLPFLFMKPEQVLYKHEQNAECGIQTTNCVVFCMSLIRAGLDLRICFKAVIEAVMLVMCVKSAMHLKEGYKESLHD